MHRCLQYTTFVVICSWYAVPAYAESKAKTPTLERPLSSSPGISTEGSTQNLTLRDVEERVNDLKERIFQSKARLMQLQEVVMHGAITGSRAVLIHRNEMGGAFQLIRARYQLDGAPIFNRSSEKDPLSDEKSINIFDGSIAPGRHELSVFLEYRGRGVGVFRYLEGYEFKVRSSYTFTSKEGQLTRIQIVGYEKGGMTTDLKDRPAVRYDVTTARARRKDFNDGGDTESSK